MVNLCECGKEQFAKGRCKKCYNKLYRQENAEKEKQRLKRYRQDNAEKIKRYRQENAEKEKQRLKRYCQELHDNYVIARLKQNTTLTAKDIRQYPELIELKKAELQVKRQLIK